jgi:hypothetical protein
VEDRRLFIDGNTDAGVAHAKTQYDFLPVGGSHGFLATPVP